MKPVLPDVQQTAPKHPLDIDRVGISGVNFPLKLKSKTGSIHTVDAIFNMYGSLVKDSRGTNMSRLYTTLMKYRDRPFSTGILEEITVCLRDILQSRDAYISTEFRYYVPKISPISKLKMLLGHKCKFTGILFNKSFRFYQEVKVPITSNCPCSKALSLVDPARDIGMGAHGQKGIITLQVKERGREEIIWLEDLIDICETSGSCEIYPLLKRPDEKYVTEKAYKNAKFVEDIAREVSTKTMKLSSLEWYRVKVENFESIHDHSAVCYMERRRKGLKWVKSYKGLI